MDMHSSILSSAFQGRRKITMNQQKSRFIHSAGVANRFLDLIEGKDKFLTQMQLQKLVYFAHGWHLAIFDSGLTDDELQAWDYGPLYTDLWLATRKYGTKPVNEKIRNRDISINFLKVMEENPSDFNEYCHAPLNHDQERLVERIFEIYGDLKAFDLSALTHQNGTPWYTIYVEQKSKRQVIPDNLIRNHFISLARPKQ